MAAFDDAQRRNPEVLRFPPEVTPSISLSRDFSAQTRGLLRLTNPRENLVRSNYGSNGRALTWAGDAAMPGESKSVAAPPTNGKNGKVNSGAAGKAAEMEYDDGFSSDFWKHVPLHATAHALSAFDLNWNDVELIGQPDGMSCWATAAAMVVAWRYQVSIDQSEVARGGGHWADFVNQGGLSAADTESFGRAWGLVVEQPQSYTIDGFRQLLASQGPLWVPILTREGGDHAIAVTGVYGDGTADGTYVRIHDPWERDRGTPTQPGTPHATPGRGCRYVLTFREFAHEYESESGTGDDGSVYIQILHSRGTSGRVPATGATQTYAVAATAYAPHKKEKRSMAAMAAAAGVASMMPTKTRRPAYALSAFDINWNDVESIGQPDGMSCWAASAAMVIGWRDQVCIDPAELARGSGHWADFKAKCGLSFSDTASFGRAISLAAEAPQSYLPMPPRDT